jgi:uncharacterized membrane protein YdbT with pleckstrin-like domain
MTDTPATTTDEVPEWLSLDDGEELQWRGEPVPVSIVGTAVWGVLLTVVLIGVLILLSLPLAWLSIKNTDYVVTNEALYVKKGVLSTNIESVGLDKIQNTEYSQSFWGKQFDFGSIDISTAGSSGAQITFQNISDARSVREQITSLSNEYTSRDRQSSTDDDESATTDAPTPMDEVVEELRATRQALERVEQHLSESSGSTEVDAPADLSSSADERPPD